LRDFSVQFLVREGCHLCDEARPIVLAAARRSGVEVVEVDVDGDDRLVAEFGLRIPVVLGPGDEVLAEGVIDDPRTLRRSLRRLER